MSRLPRQDDTCQPRAIMREFSGSHSETIITAAERLVCQTSKWDGGGVENTLKSIIMHHILNWKFKFLNQDLFYN
jgi:hypothetical protein